MQQGPFAPRALPRFNATTDPAATVSSSTVFPGPPVMRSTWCFRRTVVGEMKFRF